MSLLTWNEQEVHNDIVKFAHATLWEHFLLSSALGSTKFYPVPWMGPSAAFSFNAAVDRGEWHWYFVRQVSTVALPPIRGISLRNPVLLTHDFGKGDAFFKELRNAAFRVYDELYSPGKQAARLYDDSDEDSDSLSSDDSLVARDRSH